MTSLVKHVDTAWHIFDAHAREDIVVKPSMPILYFGDSSGYFRSERKVVTVGLNPSYREFGSQSQGYTIGLRFPRASHIMTSRTTANEQFYERYQQSLNQYFEANPYWTWFRNFEPLLSALGSDYKSNSRTSGRALHTDICSPLATNPTWSKLKAAERRQLSEDGLILWTDLVKELSPHVMLVSLGQKLRESIITLFGQVERFPDMFPENHLKKTTTYRTRIGGKRCFVAMGRSTDRGPFSTLTNEEKKQLGSRVEALASSP